MTQAEFDQMVIDLNAGRITHREFDRRQVAYRESVRLPREGQVYQKTRPHVLVGQRFMLRNHTSGQTEFVGEIVRIAQQDAGGYLVVCKNLDNPGAPLLHMTIECYEASAWPLDDHKAPDEADEPTYVAARSEGRHPAD